MKNYVCLSCGKKLSQSRNSFGKYCNNICQTNYNHNLYIQEWKMGKVSGCTKNGDTSKYIRTYIIIKYNNKCSRCGWAEINPFSGKIPLELEHIDGHHENNDESNLDLLCPNCHSLTSTYKGANIGNGRISRRCK